MAGIRDHNNPLSEQDIAKLRVGKQTLNETMLLCQKARDCGLDCRVEQAYCDALMQRYDKVFQHFVSGKQIA